MYVSNTNVNAFVRKPQNSQSRTTKNCDDQEKRGTVTVTLSSREVSRPPQSPRTPSDRGPGPDTTISRDVLIQFSRPISALINLPSNSTFQRAHFGSALCNVKASYLGYIHGSRCRSIPILYPNFVSLNCVTIFATCFCKKVAG